MIKYLLILLLLFSATALAQTAAFTTDDISKVEKTLAISKEAKATFSKVLLNQVISPNEMGNVAEVLNAQIKGNEFTQDELKNLTAIRGGNLATDKIKFLSTKILKEIKPVIK